MRLKIKIESRDRKLKREKEKKTFVAHFSFISRDKRYVVDHRLASGIFEC